MPPARRNPEDVRKAFGRALRALRRRRGYTQEQLALEGVSRGHISDLELGRCDPKLSMLCRLSELLDVPLSAFALEIQRAYRRAGGDSPAAPADARDSRSKPPVSL